MPKKKLLLHSCCGPCSTAVIERLVESGEYDITVFYYNPNITDSEEYGLRKLEQIRFLNEFHGKTGIAIPFVQTEYDPQRFFEAAEGLEDCPEGGERCRKCFELRLRETALAAKENGFDCFDTTLSVSPYKNYDVISEVGRALAEELGIEYLAGNYKKKDGYKRSIELSKEYHLYRQHYCGCVFSMPPELAAWAADPQRPADPNLGPDGEYVFTGLENGF